MKRIIFPLLLLLIAFGCTPKDEVDNPEPASAKPSTLVPSQAIGQWKLVKMVWRSQIAGKPDTSYPLPYQETLHLQPDSTFIRYRNGVKSTGTFKFKTISANAREWAFSATFDEPSVAFHTIGTYTHYFASGFSLWNGEAEYLLQDYSAFDGPTFYYQKLADK